MQEKYGPTQYRMKEYKSAVQSYQKALTISLNLHCQEHPTTFTIVLD